MEERNVFSNNGMDKFSAINLFHAIHCDAHLELSDFSGCFLLFFFGWGGGACMKNILQFAFNIVVCYK